MKKRAELMSMTLDVAEVITIPDREQGSNR